MKLLKKIWHRVNTPAVKYQPLIEVRIFKNSLLNNLQQFQTAYPKFKFAPVLKSNAYGHGLVEVAEVLDNQSLPFLIVDSFYEALVLRRAGIKSKILILGYTRTKELLNPPLKNCSAVIIDLEILKNISANLKAPANFHLKIDTGMHRQGILVKDIDEAIRLINMNSNFILEGVCSHFADSDSADSAFTEKQIEQWNKIAKLFKEHFPSIQYFHTSNTAGNRYADKIDANISRLGLGLYGIDPSEAQNLNLLPALEMASVISSIKTIPAGEKVGYGITFESSKPMRVATVPVGYNEGVDRRLSSKGSFKVNGQFCPLVGRVSMNISSVDVSNVDGLKLEDEVIIISSKKADPNSVENIAKLCGCIPYETLVNIPQNLRRIII